MRILFFILLCIPKLLYCQKEIYIPQEWQQAGGLDYSYTRSAQSDDFIVFWGPLAGDDPTQAPSDIAFDPQNILVKAEDLYKFYIDTIKFVNDDAGLIHQYKIILVMLNTWTGLEGWAFGGNYDGIVGAMWMHPQAASSGPTLAHEFAHVLQNYTWMMNPGHGFIDSSYVGFFWETHAEFMALQKYPSVALQFDMARWLNTCQFHWSSTRHHYQAFVFLQFIKEKDGIGMINRMWNESIIGEHPLETYKRLKGITQDQLNDLFGEYAMRNVTWDYEIGDLLRERQSTIDPKFISHLTIIPDSISVDLGGYRIQNHLAPQDYGYNTIRLFPQDKDSCDKKIIHLSFFGYSNNPEASAGWRYGFVAVKNGMEARYSPLYRKNEDVTFEVFDEEEIYFVVCGAPSVHHNYRWEAGFPKIYRFPYGFKIEGAIPEGYQPGYRQAPAVPGTLHPNGGGFVASSAHADASAYIGPDAQVLDHAQVLGKARVEDHAIVQQSAVVRDTAKVSGDAIIGEDAQVYGQAWVAEQAHIYGGSSIYGKSRVSGNSLIFFSNVYEYARLRANTFCWGANLHGDIVLGGDAEFFHECSAGTYLQVETAYDRNCDGQDFHPSNVDINTFPFYTGYVPDFNYIVDCSSILTMDFHIICQGDTFNWNGTPLTEYGFYTDTLISMSGLDSIVTLELVTMIPLELYGFLKLCKGDTIILEGHPITEPGTYILTNDTIYCGEILHAYVEEINIDTGVLFSGNSLYAFDQDATCQWYDCDTNTPIPGAIQHDFTPTVNGSYKVKLTTIEGCEAFSSCYEVSTVAIQSPPENIQWHIYPNPVRDYLLIHSENNNWEQGEVEIWDILGRIQIKKTFTAPNTIHQIDVSGLSPGTFVIKVIDSNRNFSSKLFSKI